MIWTLTTYPGCPHGRARAPDEHSGHGRSRQGPGLGWPGGNRGREGGAARRAHYPPHGPAAREARQAAAEALAAAGEARQAAEVAEQAQREVAELRELCGDQAAGIRALASMLTQLAARVMSQPPGDEPSALAMLAGRDGHDDVLRVLSLRRVWPGSPRRGTPCPGRPGHVDGAPDLRRVCP